jgi:hypothetical protein
MKRDRFWFYRKPSCAGKPIKFGDLVSKIILVTTGDGLASSYGIVVGVHKLGVPLIHWDNGTEGAILSTRLTLVKRA